MKTFQHKMQPLIMSSQWTRQGSLIAHTPLPYQLGNRPDQPIEYVPHIAICGGQTLQQKSGDVHFHPHSRLPCGVPKLKQFFATLFSIKLNNIQHYWSGDTILSTTFSSSLMKKHRLVYKYHLHDFYKGQFNIPSTSDCHPH